MAPTTKLTFFITAILLCQACVASESVIKHCESPSYTSTAQFSEATARAEQLASKYGADQVLLVFDIDNTLLAMNQWLGSDQWFVWQFGLLLENNDNPELFQGIVNIPDLLEAQRLLYDVSAMSPPEVAQPNILKRLQQKGFQKIMLTSRGPEMRSSTERELWRNGYQFDETNLIANKPRAYYPYAIDNLDADGLGLAELHQYRLLKKTTECQNKERQNKELTPKSIDLQSCVIPPELISFQNGLYMTSGQNKGLMLKMLLEDAGYFNTNKSIQRFKAIVFVDDTHKHILDMHNSFCKAGIDMNLFHYTREEQDVDAFHQSDKSKLRERWQNLLNTLQPFQ